MENHYKNSICIGAVPQCNGYLLPKTNNGLENDDFDISNNVVHDLASFNKHGLKIKVRDQ